jgi:hypothetical protein
MGYMKIDISSGDVSETTENTTDVTINPQHLPLIPEDSKTEIEPLVPDGHIIEREEEDEDAIRNSILRNIESIT